MPLPKAKDDLPNPIMFQGRRLADDERPDEEPIELPQIRKYEALNENRIVVPERVYRYHPLLKETRKSITIGDYDRYPRVC